MENKYFVPLFVCASLLIGSCMTTGEAFGNSAYRYYRLYKNSETYKKINGTEEEKSTAPSESEEQEQGYENDEQYPEDSPENAVEPVENGSSSTWYNSNYDKPLLNNR